ncbi:MAG: tetratricopeptide repeat protein [Candidatus Kariarchaeaceae archaeon]
METNKIRDDQVESDIDDSSQLTQAMNFDNMAHEYFEQGELDKALHTYMQSLSTYEQIENHLKVAETLTKIGVTYNSKGELDKAILSYSKSLEIYENQSPDDIENATVLYHMANVYHDKGELDQALNYWEQALPVFQNANLDLETANTLRHIGFINQDKGKESSIDYFKRAIPLFEKINSIIDLANLNYSIGLVYSSIDEVDQAIKYYNRALELYKITENPYDEAETMYSLCIAYKDKGDLRKSINYYVQALSLYEHNPSLINKVGSLREIGLNYFKEEEVNEALEKNIESFRQWENSSNQTVKATGYQNMAFFYKTKGDLEQAFSFNKKALTIFNELEDSRQGSILQNLGLISHKLNKLRQALNYYNKAIPVLEKSENFIELGYVYTGIGNIYLSKGQPNRSIKNFQKGLDLFERHPDFLGSATVLTGLGNSYRSKGELDRALEMYLQTLDLYEKSSNPMDEASTLYFIGETYFIKQQFDVALEKYERALNIYDQSLNTVDKARVLTGIGNVYRIQDNLKEAIARYLDALVLFEDRDHPEKAYTLKNIAEAYIIKEEYDEAKKHIKEAMGLLKNSPNPLDMAIPLNKLGKIYYALGDHKAAFALCAQAAELFGQSPNPLDIFKPLQEIYRFEPKKAVSLALSSPLGINWYLKTMNQYIADSFPLTCDHWYNLWLASSNWWDDVKSNVSKDTLTSGIYERNWRIKFLLEETQRNITSATTLNYLFGANDITADKIGNYRELRNVHEQLNPMWFVEIPSRLAHGERYLKIRLNNLIKSKGEFTSYPTVEKSEHPAVARIKLNLETQWLQKITIDHIFYPNSEIEHKSYQLDPKNAWLKDVVIMDLGTNLKGEDNLELLYSIEIYFDPNSTFPDIKTTSKRITIPVIRTNNFQELEKFKENHANSLAVFIALWSIFFATLPYLIDYNNLLFSDFNFLSLLTYGSIILSVGIFFILLLLRGKNKDKIVDSLHRSSIGVGIDSVLEDFIPPADIINLDEVESEYSVDLQDTVPQANIDETKQ